MLSKENVSSFSYNLTISGNVALSEQCCSTIFDDIEKIVHIPALIKPIAMSACQQIPGSGKEACGTICSALAPFGIEGPCHQVCDGAMESIHCENGATGNEGNFKDFTFFRLHYHL